MWSVFDANGRLLAEDVDQSLPMYATDLYLRLKGEIALNRRLLPLHDHDDLSLQSLLSAPNRDFLISNQGNKVIHLKMVFLWSLMENQLIHMLPKSL